MSLRKGVLLRSHRKSISEMDMKTRNGTTLNGTYIKDKKEPKNDKEEASHVQNKHNRSKRKSKESKKQNKETSIPLAQSTLIQTPIAAEKKLSISMIDESGIEFLKIDQQKEKTLVEMALDNKRQEKLPKEHKIDKENKMPPSSQENIDSMMEYKYKVERLCGILDHFKEQYAELASTYQKQVKENKESREEMNKTLFELESDKYQLQQTVQSLKNDNEKANTEREKANTEREKANTENEKLKTRILALEKEKQAELAKEQELEQQKIMEKEKEEQDRREKEEKENPLKNMTTSSLDISATLATLPHDTKFSRTKRKSLLSETIIALSLPDTEKVDFYENIILDQQDILDFYSLLCGTSVGKPKQTQIASKEGDCDTVNEELEYHCRVQQRNRPLEDYPFIFKLNMHLREVKYIPCKDEILFQNYKEHLPCTLQTSLKHDADEAYLFLKELVTIVGEPST